MNGEIVRKDSKIRILGDRAFIGDQEIFGKLSIRDKSDRLIWHFNPDTGTLSIYDTDGNEVWHFDTTTGNLTINGDKINTNAEISVDLNLEHWFTGVSTYEKITGTSWKMDGDNFVNQDIYFEANMLVEQSGRTGYLRIFNETDNTPLSGAELTTTHVGTYDATRGIYTDWDVVRCGPLTIPSGGKKYCLQVKQVPAGNGGDKVHIFQARLVVIQQ